MSLQNMFPWSEHNKSKNGKIDYEGIEVSESYVSI